MREDRILYRRAILAPDLAYSIDGSAVIAARAAALLYRHVPLSPVRTLDDRGTQHEPKEGME